MRHSSANTTNRARNGDLELPTTNTGALSQPVEFKASEMLSECMSHHFSQHLFVPPTLNEILLKIFTPFSLRQVFIPSKSFSVLICFSIIKISASKVKTLQDIIFTDFIAQ